MPKRVHTPTFPPVAPQPLPPIPEVTSDILARCEKLGFAAAGITPALPTSWKDEILAWLAQGKHATMNYLARDLDLKFEPARVFDGAQAFIMVADLYAARNDPPTPAPPLHARIARYAQGRDYHRVMKDRLHDLSDSLRATYRGYGFRSFVDTVPVLERELAALAGLGWQAKNTMIINPGLGSYTLLGGIATTLPLVAPAQQPTITDHCGSCTRCIQACPTQAITPYSVDASRCISYLTIEHREPIDPAFHAAMGDWLYGCDICQEVCPHNSPRPDADTGTRHPAYQPRSVTLPLLEVLNWTDTQRRESLRASPMKRATLAMMKRNALIAAGNALSRVANPDLLARIQTLATAHDEPALVTETAAAILHTLNNHQRPGCDSNARPAV